MSEPNSDAWIDEQIANISTRLPLAHLADSLGDLPSGDARLTVDAVLQDIARGDSFATALEQCILMSYDTFISGLATGP